MSDEAMSAKDHPAWGLPARWVPRWVDAPGEAPDSTLPPDIRREGLWIIEDFDIVWEAPLAGLMLATAVLAIVEDER